MPTQDIGTQLAGGTRARQLPSGFRHLPAALDRAAQGKLLDTVLRAMAPIGWLSPTMPRTGRPFSVRMANLGPLGWVSDRSGYRYQPTHPETGEPWPAMPEEVLALWRELADYPHPPECCLVNFYDGNAKLGLHRDEDEADTAAPVLSVSLGDAAMFRLGGLHRQAASHSFKLTSGDIVILGGQSRLAFHGITRVLPGTSTLVPGGGRVNLTVRRVTLP
jgi:alkylated DNA repair protein (DNA oxidative demethylase)